MPRETGRSRRKAKAPAVAAAVLALARVHVASAEQGAFIDAVTQFCYQNLIADGECCKDALRGPGVHQKSVTRPGTDWICSAGAHCFDAQPGRRGTDQLWWPDGADCTTPRVLYVHGGDWLRFGPDSGAYDAFASKFAAEANAVVLVPDFPLAPFANFTGMMRALDLAWFWLSRHGADAEDCSASPDRPPLFVAGDSSGAASALSFLLRLSSGHAGQGLLAAAGFVGYSPWTNLACNSPTFYTNSFAAIEEVERQGAMAVVGDILYRASPERNSANLRQRALQYVGGDPTLLTDPIMSPFFALDVHLRSLPPMYFAVAGSEARTGDGILLAGRAAMSGVLMVQDVFDGAWHNFHLYSEGCGSGTALWQGGAALKRSGDFVRKVASAAIAGRSIRRSVGGSPQTSMYYMFPTGHAAWVEVRDLELQLSDGGVPSPAALPPSPSPSCEPSASDSRGQGSCPLATVAGAFLTGAAGGAVATVLVVAFAWAHRAGGGAGGALASLGRIAQLPTWQPRTLHAAAVETAPGDADGLVRGGAADDAMPGMSFGPLSPWRRGGGYEPLRGDAPPSASEAGGRGGDEGKAWGSWLPKNLSGGTWNALTPRGGYAQGTEAPARAASPHGGSQLSAGGSSPVAAGHTPRNQDFGRLQAMPGPAAALVSLAERERPALTPAAQGRW